jgi:hypothetical protein
VAETCPLHHTIPRDSESANDPQTVVSAGKPVFPSVHDGAFIYLFLFLLFCFFAPSWTHLDFCAPSWTLLALFLKKNVRRRGHFLKKIAVRRQMICAVLDSDTFKVRRGKTKGGGAFFGIQVFFFHHPHPPNVPVHLSGAQILFEF